MTDPVTVFMLVVAGLLVVGTVGEQVFARTGVPSVIWLVMLGVLVRVADIVPASVIDSLAPFFAALALVIILFDAGTNLTGGTGEAALAPATRRRAQLLAFIGFAVTVTVVALFSWALAGLGILKFWGWPNALMLGSLVACGASEVALPSLKGLPGVVEATALLRRESAITKALAVTGTVLCLDLLSPRVGEGGAALAMAAGFGFALAFGGVAGMLWVVALHRLARMPDSSDSEARDYGFTLAVLVVLYVLSEAAGGSGPLSVLVFGAVLGNADGILSLFRRAAGERGEAGPGVAVQAVLGGHARTIHFVRTLVFAMVGLTLAPPWGPIVMGVALAVLLLVVRLAVARFTLAGVEHRERSIVGACAPRGMATIALVTLVLAHAVPGASEMVTLVFAAVTTSVLLFTLGLYGLRGLAPPGPVAPVVARGPAPSLASVVAAEVAASHPGMTLPSAPVVDMGPSGPSEASGPTMAISGTGVSSVSSVSSASGTELAAATSGPELVRASVSDSLRRSECVPTAQSMQAELSPRPESEMNRNSRPMQSARVSGPMAAASRISGPVVAASRISGPVQAARSSGPVLAARPVEPGPGADDARAPTLPREMSGPRLAEASAPQESLRQVLEAPGPRPLPEPEGYLPTLLQIEGSQSRPEDPLAGALAGALAKRPVDVTQARRRPTGDYEVPPPTFTGFPSSSEENALSLLAVLGMRDDDAPAEGSKPS